MDHSMRQKCDKKLKELQESMPFLLRVLERLRNNNQNDPARQTQLDKIQKLYHLLNDRSQTFKWDLLVKCENVVIKLQRKLELQGETDFLFKHRSPPKAEKRPEVENVNEIKREDLNCPESPPPQPLDQFENIQPVVIPTERRCSPPVSSKRIESHSPKRKERNELEDRKTNHHRHSHHHQHRRREHQERHHHQQSHERHKKHEDLSFESSRSQSIEIRSSNSKKESKSFNEQEKQSAAIEQYLSMQRKRQEEMSEDIFQRRNQNIDFHNSEANCTRKQTNPFEEAAKKLSMNVKQSSNHPSTNVFSRLGEKINVSDDDKNAKMKDKHYKSTHFNTTPNLTIPKVKETSTVIPDFLKSPPLSASDITLLLNEANSNSSSNPSEPLGISEIGTRRNTPVTSIAKQATINAANNASSLDMVRKKFALLTKKESPSSPSPTYSPYSPTNTEIDSSNKSMNSTNLRNNFQTSPASPPRPIESIAIKYSPSRSTIGLNTVSTSIVPNSNVNVLPTLRPNDPRLRKQNANFTSNGNSTCSTLPPNNNVPKIVPRPVMPPTVNLLSPTPSTPSPIYGNAYPTPLPFATKTPSQTHLSDPRLQRQQSANSYIKPTPTRPPLISNDSSDENWDVDDNARDVVFPQPRPFPNRNQIYHSNAQGGTTIPPMSPSTNWDNVFPTPNRPANNMNHHTNRNAVSVMPSTTNFNSNSFSNLKSNAPAALPLTYGAYKEARARAAAEQAARKAAEQAKSNNELSNKTERSPEETNPKIGVAHTNLDTTYRKTNLPNSEATKSLDFKIPKKTAVCTTTSTEKNAESKEKTKTNLEKPPKEEHKSSKETTSQKAIHSKEQSEETSSCSKTQRKRFRDKNTSKETVTPMSEEKNKAKSISPEKYQSIENDNISASDTSANDTLKLVIDESKDIDSEENLNKDDKLNNKSLACPPQTVSPKLQFLSTPQPARILKRRCTMIERASAPEVDKEKLDKANAMLFEDLQDRERKKNNENKTQITTIRRHGEICYDKTDDGCTVSTQNIITGKRRTRTTANFNEVQQGIAVFKHLKTSEQKKESTTPSEASPAANAKGRKKPGPKPNVKNTKAVGNQTTPTQPVKKTKTKKKGLVNKDGQAKTNNNEEKQTVEPKSQDEKQEKSINSSDLYPDVTSIFDTFMQKILQPNANAEDRIDKLKDILSAQEIETLYLLREAMFKKQGNNSKETKNADMTEENPVSVEEPNNKNDKISDVQADETMHVGAGIQAGARKHAPRRSELDRLHDDIREMFISEGVLTATGKRMCKIVEPTANATETSQSTASPEQPFPQLPVGLRLRKPRVMLPAVKIKETTKRPSTRKGQTISNAVENENKDEEQDATMDDDGIDAQAITNCQSICSGTSASTDMIEKTVSPVPTMNTDSNTSSNDNSPIRPMPTLKPLKPIRSLIGNDDEVNGNDELEKEEKPKQRRYKPCPRSKKPPDALVEDDNDDIKADTKSNVSLDVDVKKHSTNIAELNHSTDEIKADCAQTKIKTELIDIDVPYELDMSSTEDGENTLKNINPKWHWISRYAQKCVVCKHKAVHMSIHYKKNHSENYVSRLAPVILHQLKKEPTTINKPFMRLSEKKSSVMLFRCPFCFQFKHTSPVSWIEHFITHTGEYLYECTLCRSSFNKASWIERHMNDKCAKLGGRYLHNDEIDKSCKKKEIKAHICHLCNYLRLGRSNLERHYMEQHSYDVKNINDTVGYTITLMKLENVPLAATLEEILKMEIKLNQEYQSDIILLDDEDAGSTDNEKEKVTKNEIETNAEKPTTSSNISIDNEIIEIDNKTNPSSPAKSVVNKKFIMQSMKKKVFALEKTMKRQKINKKSKMGTKITNKSQLTDSNTSSMITNTTKSIKDMMSPPKVADPPVSSAFMSTTDDSNDGETPSILARQIFTIDGEADLCSKSPSMSKLGGSMSIAERLCQRLKEANIAQRYQENEAVKATNQQNQNNVEESTSSEQNNIVAEQNLLSKPNDEPANRTIGAVGEQENDTFTVPGQKEQNISEVTRQFTSQAIEKQSMETEKNAPCTPIEQQINVSHDNIASSTSTPEKVNEEKATKSKNDQHQDFKENDFTLPPDRSTKSQDTQLKSTMSEEPSANVLDSDKKEEEIDLTMDEDDDDWEDIEIVETAVSSVTTTSTPNQGIKETKSQKNKTNPLQTLSRLYANIAPSTKTSKKSKPFKPLLTIFSGANSLSKECLKIPKETPKAMENCENTLTPAAMTPPTNLLDPKPSPIADITKKTTVASDQQSVLTSSVTSVQGFRPMIANLDDLLPDSPSTDPIDLAPELAPSGPLQELNDISTFLGTNLNGIMDIDVEDPANSVCIHNTDNQQTSIQEALDFVDSQTAGYGNVEQTLNLNVENNDNLLIAAINMNRIQNIGYTCSTDGEKISNEKNLKRFYKFYCFSNCCTFLYSSEAIGLENHFLLEHPTCKWSGYCNTCATQIETSKTTSELTFSDEFRHLLGVHIKPTDLITLAPVSDSAPAPAPSTTTATVPILSASSNTEATPRLKLRRLSGDCLSSATVQNDSISSALLDTYDDSNSFSDLIHFNTAPLEGNDRLFDEELIPTSTIERLPDNVPFFTNVSKDFEITSISSGLEPKELSAIVKNALNTEAMGKNSGVQKSFDMQISKVMSLNESLVEKVSSSKTNTTTSPPMVTSAAEFRDLTLPKITNVCSLNSGAATTPTIGSLWSESNKVASSPAANSPASKRNRSPSIPRSSNDSPGPMIVSETLPTAQAQSGDFVITQTVSAQYAEEATNCGGVLSSKPTLGFNISISSAISTMATAAPSPTPIPTENVDSVPKTCSALKPQLSCMESSCKFTTRHFVAIIDHVKWHEQRNDAQQHEYLRCSLCKNKLRTVDEFTRHLRIEHYTGRVSPQTSSEESTVAEGVQSAAAAAVTVPIVESCALTQKIRNILSQNQVEITAKECSSLTTNNNSNRTSGNLEDPTNSLLYQTIKEMVAKTGISEIKLFRCLVKDCNVRLNENTYHIHVLYHLTTIGSVNNPLTCPHCKLKFSNISVLKTHIRIHGRHRIFCYLCMETTVDDAQMTTHFSQKHWHKKELSKSLLIQHGDSNVDVSSLPIAYYVTNLTPLTENNVRDFGNKLILEWQRKKAATRTHFNPDEIALLPIQAIFSKEIYCAVCFYKTKVRTNMIRHMTQHKNTPTNSLGGSAIGSAYISANAQNDGNINENVLVCSMDPVNPVPCLISNEKHFDRMTNLASSSLGPIVPQSANTSTAGGGNTVSSSSSYTSAAICKLRYTYIPQAKRFKCGMSNCNFHTICEDIFRTHLNTEHNEARSYKCLFCSEELVKRNLSVEKIIQHLRFHDRTMYQCEQCKHNHYIRHVIDRHALEKHGPVGRAHILMFTRDIEGSLEGTRKVLVTFGKKVKDTNSSGNISESAQGIDVENNILTASARETKSAKNALKFPKFICDLCEHKTVTYNQLIAHSNSMHGFKQPYQCPYCLTFTAWVDSNVKTHITEQHAGEILKVNRLFGKMNTAQLMKSKKEFLEQMKKGDVNEAAPLPPPKPLWQRDDPKRARQIRGIPMEDEEESERLSKRLRLNEDYYDEDDSQQLAEYSTSNLYLNRFEFGCFYCEYKANNIDDLKNNHWDSVHGSMDCLSSKPFLFRLLIRLKCAECQSFVGCHWELLKHMTINHEKLTCHAMDPRAKKLVCGYCEYDCASTAQLLRHYLRDDHQAQDVKGLSSLEMAKVMRLECSSPITYVHCTLCSELFNSRLAVVTHCAEKHEEESEHFSFRELNNKTIYQCPECMYSATDELTTLRHMINHFERFKSCHFCNQPQSSFNDYMQHCYSEHRTEIRRFSEIYTFAEIRKYLMQVLIIFPNGWIINKKNLRTTPYGNEERLKTLYAEICKTSQQPPIPRLSIGRLVARKSIEAKLQQNQQIGTLSSDTSSTAAVLQLAGNSFTSIKKQATAQKISKRRNTIAVGNDDDNSYKLSSKKQKLSTHIVTNRTISMPLPPKFDNGATEIKNKQETKCEEPYSYYGKRPDAEDWSKLYTKITIAGLKTPITLDKFKILVQIDSHVVLEKLNIDKYKLPRNVCYAKEEKNVAETENDTNTIEKNMPNPYAHVKKACPASQKYRYI